MADFLVQLVVAGVIMGLIDGVWLGIVANKLYKKELGSLLRDKPNMVSAVLFYIIYVVGIVVFAVMPGLEDGMATVSLGLGALFGFVAYATYDLTNLATAKGFSTKIVVVDMIWGAALTGTVAFLTHLIVSTWL